MKKRRFWKVSSHTQGHICSGAWREDQTLPAGCTYWIMLRCPHAYLFEFLLAFLLTSRNADGGERQQQEAQQHGWGKEEEKTTRFPYYGPCFRRKEQLQLLPLIHSLTSCSFLRPKRGSQKREEGVGGAAASMGPSGCGREEGPGCPRPHRGEPSGAAPPDPADHNPSKQRKDRPHLDNISGLHYASFI